MDTSVALISKIDRNVTYLYIDFTFTERTSIDKHCYCSKKYGENLEKLSKYVMDKYPTHLFSKRISLSYMTKKSKIDPMDADNED